MNIQEDVTVMRQLEWTQRSPWKPQYPSGKAYPEYPIVPQSWDLLDMLRKALRGEMTTNYGTKIHPDAIAMQVQELLHEYYKGMKYVV